MEKAMPMRTLTLLILVSAAVAMIAGPTLFAHLTGEQDNGVSSTREELSVAKPDAGGQQSVEPADVSPSRFRLTFDDLALKDKIQTSFDPAALPESIRGYEGGGVRITGVMQPSYHSDGLTNFWLMRNSECRFGRDDPWHFIRVYLAAGETIGFSIQPQTVSGTLSFEAVLFGPQIAGIYRLDEATVQ